MKHVSELIATEPIEVDLPVCEECRKRGIKTVGKLPTDRGTRYQGFCTGPAEVDHRKTKMVTRQFREVRDETSGPGWPE